MTHALPNEDVAGVLDRIGDRLIEQGANRFRAGAYHEAAAVIRDLERPVASVLEQGGRAALTALPHVGDKLAAVIAEIVSTGTSRLLERIEGRHAPEELFARLPGVGEELAHRIVEQLELDTLEGLEAAAHDGRLEAVAGFGPGRVERVRRDLERALGRPRRPATPGGEAPDVALLLAIDRHYRDLADAGALPTIAPRRFNPGGRRWLPIWHPHADGWHITAMYSNSARAHRLGKTRDWVVIDYERGAEEGRCTAVTEHRGPLAGQRVIRGRESECAAHHRQVVARAEISAWAHRQLERLSQ